ncbi:MAG: hypothetical protein ACP5I4_07780 [Oceanipulchritudo sp.]
MPLLGLLVQLGTIGFLVYLGYTVQLNYILILISPLGLIIGHLMRKTKDRSSKRGGGFLNFVTDLVSAYIVGLVIAVVCFGVGYALLHILDLRPEEGIGRYN